MPHCDHENFDIVAPERYAEFLMILAEERTAVYWEVRGLIDMCTKPQWQYMRY